MSHVYAAKYLLPNMINRNQGYFLQIISAAALLSQIGDAAYSASKSAALSFAESLAINNGHLGIKVSAVCPQYIASPIWEWIKIISQKIKILFLHKQQLVGSLKV